MLRATGGAARGTGIGAVMSWIGDEAGGAGGGGVGDTAAICAVRVGCGGVEGGGTGSFVAIVAIGRAIGSGVLTSGRSSVNCSPVVARG